MHYDVTRYNRQATELWKRIKEKSESVTSGEYLSRFKKESKLYPQVTFQDLMADSREEGKMEGKIEEKHRLL